MFLLAGIATFAFAPLKPNEGAYHPEQDDGDQYDSK